ncbi:hypothetical protein [Jiella sonneratiae]|uniref:Uncharacterized protein n=1 Tax=Jiella sonneratiae TaxID=2816856 RepID=A0ABS3J811_9HYPH|nr:hypothetical protein [Jiella sonneratiae]MBO0905811.1 hypothetical protein [Jiella sonneratiae]
MRILTATSLAVLALSAAALPASAATLHRHHHVAVRQQTVFAHGTRVSYPTTASPQQKAINQSSEPDAILGYAYGPTLVPGDESDF